MSWTFLFWEILYWCFNFIMCYRLIRWLISSWFTLDECKYLEICPFLQGFQIYWHIGSQSSPWWFPGFPWCLLLSSLLIFDFNNLGLSFLTLVRFARACQSCLFFQRTNFCFIDSLYDFLGLYFINFGPYFYYFSPFACFEFCSFLFSMSLRCRLGCLFEIFSVLLYMY
jgi:hypothetical protein